MTRAGSEPAWTRERMTPSAESNVQAGGTTRCETQRRKQELLKQSENSTKREADVAALIERNELMEAENSRLEREESERKNRDSEEQQRMRRLQAELDDVKRTAAAAEKANSAWLDLPSGAGLFGSPCPPPHQPRNHRTRSRGERALTHARLSATCTLTVFFRLRACGRWQGS